MSCASHDELVACCMQVLWAAAVWSTCGWRRCCGQRGVCGTYLRGDGLACGHDHMSMCIGPCARPSAASCRQQSVRCATAYSSTQRLHNSANQADAVYPTANTHVSMFAGLLLTCPSSIPLCGLCHSAAALCMMDLAHHNFFIATVARGRSLVSHQHKIFDTSGPGPIDPVLTPSVARTEHVRRCRCTLFSADNVVTDCRHVLVMLSNSDIYNQLDSCSMAGVIC
jgi:hypothetical protein